MIEERSIKTHLIITSIHDEFSMNWCGKIIDTKPLFKNDMPVFIVVGRRGRVELNTFDMARIENIAKQLTQPKGRAAIRTDKSYIYIKEENENEALLGVMTHRNIKTYAPMYDKVKYCGVV